MRERNSHSKRGESAMLHTTNNEAESGALENTIEGQSLGNTAGVWGIWDVDEKYTHYW